MDVQQAQKLEAEAEALFNRLQAATRDARVAGNAERERKAVNAANKAYWRWARRHDRLGIAHYLSAIKRVAA